jgi:hypothetical protein
MSVAVTSCQHLPPGCCCDGQDVYSWKLKWRPSVAGTSIWPSTCPASPSSTPAGSAFWSPRPTGRGERKGACRCWRCPGRCSCWTSCTWRRSCRQPRAQVPLRCRQRRLTPLPGPAARTKDAVFPGARPALAFLLRSRPALVASHRAGRACAAFRSSSYAFRSASAAWLSRVSFRCGA